MSRIDPPPITELTEEQRARIPEFIGKWRRIELSTEPVDRPRAEAAIRGLYTLAKLREPKIFWLPCPLSAGTAAVGSMAIAATPRSSPEEREAIAGAVSSSVARYLDPALRPDFSSVLRSAVLSAVASAPSPVTRTAKRTAILASVYSAIDRATALALDPVVNAATRSTLRAAVDSSLVPLIRSSVVAAMLTAGHAAMDTCSNPLVKVAMKQAVRAARNSYLAGSLRLGVCAWADYFDRVLGVSLDRSFLELAESGCHCWMLDGICFASERPSRIDLTRDAAGRPHSEAGPTIAYPSGWGMWHWHGVEVPQAVIEQPETITVAAIEEEKNVEIRRAMIERYRHGAALHGAAAYLRDAGAERLDHDEAHGTLWRRAVPYDQPIVMVEVVNSTADSDGSFKHHFLRVPPDTKTAREAVAWSFGLGGKDYAPEKET